MDLLGDDDPASMSNTPISRIYGDETNIADTKTNTGEEAIDSSSSSSSCKESANTNSMAAEKESPFSVNALPAGILVFLKFHLEVKQIKHVLKAIHNDGR